MEGRNLAQLMSELPRELGVEEIVVRMVQELASQEDDEQRALDTTADAVRGARGHAPL